MICRYGKFRSNASLFRWQVFSFTWGPIYSPVMSSISSMRSLIFPRNTDVLLWFSFAGGLSPTTRTPARTFSAVSEPPRLKQLDTAMMYLCHQFCGNTDKLGWRLFGQLSCSKPRRSIKIMVILNPPKQSKTPFFPGWVLGILRLGAQGRALQAGNAFNAKFVPGERMASMGPMGSSGLGPVRNDYCRSIPVWKTGRST